MKVNRQLGRISASTVAVVLSACGGGGGSETATIASADRESAAAVVTTWAPLTTEWLPFKVSGTQTVRFGSGGSWIEKSVTGSGYCTNSYFGRDPSVGIFKRCELKGTLDDAVGGWVWVANEWQVIPNEGSRKVRFGAGSSWVEKTISGSLRCTSAAFGRDPLVGTTKKCYAWNDAVGQDLPPVAKIDKPVEGATFKAGDEIAYSGSATDKEDGTLGPNSLVFSAELHHDEHSHPFLAATVGNSGKVKIPTRGETSPHIFYRFTLQATDKAGNVVTTNRDVLPQKSTMQFVTVPAGLSLSLDGQPIAVPTSVVGVVGMERDLGAADQIVNGRRYRFDRWNDGGAAQHTISTPVANTTYTATFTDLGSAINQAPSIALSAGRTATNGTPTTLVANATDSDGKITKVGFFDGSTLLGERTSSPFELSWTPLTNGVHLITARATDDEGATATSAAVSITVSAPSAIDTQPPQATLTSPASLATNLQDTITLAATATDNVGVKRVDFEIDGMPVGQVAGGAPYRVSLDTTAFASGQHVLRTRAVDAAGNLSPWSTATVSLGGNRALPSGFSRNEGWITGLTSATSIAQAPDGRFLVTEQGGALRVIKNGVLLADPMLRVSTKATGERGLLGIALHPQFTTNGYVYVYYTSNENGVHNRISRFVANGDTSTGAEKVLVDLPPLTDATNHNGGALHFGTDGKLYVGVGENAIPKNSQDLSTPLGKLLRFNDDGSIPSDNPFYKTQSGLARSIWAYGLRNPFTFAIDPVSGRIHINDVGQVTWEEINLGAPGANYGWPVSEGKDRLASGMTGPLFTYKHDAVSPAGSGPGGFFVGFCIVGGAFYPADGNFPAAYRGSYFFADYVSKFVGRVDMANGNAAYAFASLTKLPIDLIVGQDGALYVLQRAGIARISAN